MTMKLIHSFKLLTRVGVVPRLQFVLTQETLAAQLWKSNFRVSSLSTYSKPYTYDINLENKIAMTSLHQTSIHRFLSSNKSFNDASTDSSSKSSSDSSNAQIPTKSTDESSSEPSDDKTLTVFQRFTKVYKEYGKTLIVVHVVTSVFWYGGFYLVAKSGINVLPLLVKLGVSAAIQAKFAAAGDFLIAYLLYEIAKPVRYIFTMAATRQVVVYLRKSGYLPPIKPEDKLRNLAKDGRDNLKDKYQVQREDMKERYAEKKAEYSNRWKIARRRNPMRRHSPRNYGVGSRHNGLPPHGVHGTGRHHKKPPEKNDSEKSHKK